ncbi:hypothetical protein ACXYMU_06085 [Pontibacter sp. CAU 1760]
MEVVEKQITGHPTGFPQDASAAHDFAESATGFFSGIIKDFVAT